VRLGCCDAALGSRFDIPLGQSDEVAVSTGESGEDAAEIENAADA
jgi:hypothetical protein